MKSTIKAVVLTLAISMMSVAAFAQTTTTNANNITANVVENCRIENFAVAFGAYDPTSTVATDASGTVRVRCTRGTVASIEMGLGANEGGTGIRKMTDGTDLLDYILYSDALRTTEWTVASPLAYTATDAAWATQTIYGRIPAEQLTVGVGNYVDTVQATINF